MATANSNTMTVYVGTYTKTEPHAQGKAEGIYVYRMDPATGGLTLAHTTQGVSNPSFLALDPTRRYLYAVNEVAEVDGEPGGAVSAFSVDASTGALTYLNRQSTHGDAPCHLSIDQTGRYVIAANYGGGSVAMFPILDGGALAPASDFVQHAGSSVDPGRQHEPHAHSATIDPTNRFVLVCDLGLDKILTYRLDLTNGKLVPHDTPWAQTTAGSGPRHFAFHPGGRFAYAINELDSTLTSFTYHQEQGTLTEIGSGSTVPAGFTGWSHCADVHVAPNGRFVYGSNRGHDSIAIFAIDHQTGNATLIGHESTQGKTPRNFAIDPTGTILLAANQNSDTVVAYRIDQESGKLTPTGQVTPVPTPVCLHVVASLEG